MSAEELNDQRVIVAVVRAVCARRGISLAGFSQDWVFCLQHGDRKTYLFGYDFSLNNAASRIICKDKSATSDLLGHHRVPRVEHQIFHGPQLTGYVPMGGNWTEMLAYFRTCGGDVVCKPNEGSGGKGVVRARTVAELEAAVLGIYGRSRSLCLSPYLEIHCEYRAAMLDGEIQFVYAKRRPVVRADGRRTVQALLAGHLAEAADFKKVINEMAEMPADAYDYGRVPPPGDEVRLNWRHNLAQGAMPELLGPEHPLYESICALAKRAASALEVRLASVDVVETTAGLMVLEVNCGIMMERLARLHPEGPAMAEKFYDKIICRALGLAP